MRHELCLDDIWLSQRTFLPHENVFHNLNANIFFKENATKDRALTRDWQCHPGITCLWPQR